MIKQDQSRGYQLVPVSEGSSSGTRLIALSDWPRHHPHPSLAGLRHIRFFCRINGFEKVFVKLVRRVLIDEKKFFEVIAKKNADQAKKK